MIKKIQKGNHKAFEELFRSYYAPLCRFVNLYVHDISVAEEVVQGLFVRLWEIREQWNPGGTVKSYLYRAARNRALDYLKHEKVKESHKEKIKQTYQNPKNPTEDSYTTREFEAEVQKAIEDLPEKCRIIYKLHREKGFTYAEIAEVLDISTKTVEAQISRAIKIFREKLKPWLT